MTRGRNRLAAMWVLVGLLAWPGAAAGASATEGDAQHRWEELTAQVNTLYREQRVPEAITVAQQALDMAERDLGSRHPAVAASLNNLAGLYAAQGAYDQAEPLYQRALAIKQRTLGPAHPSVATSLNNLALLYTKQERYTEAEMLYLDAIEILHQAVGPDHPFVAQVSDNLNTLLRLEMEAATPEPTLPEPDHPGAIDEVLSEPFNPAESGDTDTIALLKWKLQAMEEALGPVHPHVAELLSGIARQYYIQGQYDQAEPLYQRALGIVEQSLGPEDPAVALAANNLAALYITQHRDEEAEALYRRALAIDERTSAQDDRRITTGLQRLIDFYITRERWADAAPLYARWIAFIEESFGPKDPEVASLLDRYATCLEALGKTREARDARTRAERIRPR